MITKLTHPDSGLTLSVPEWAERLNVSPKAIYWRISRSDDLRFILRKKNTQKPKPQPRPKSKKKYCRRKLSDSEKTTIRKIQKKRENQKYALKKGRKFFNKIRNKKKEKYNEYSRAHYAQNKKIICLKNKIRYHKEKGNEEKVKELEAKLE